MNKRNQCTITSTYYGLATSTYMETRHMRHLTETEVDTLDCGQLSALEFECELDCDAHNYMMTGHDFGNSVDFDMGYYQHERAYDKQQLSMAINEPFHSTGDTPTFDDPMQDGRDDCPF